MYPGVSTQIFGNEKLSADHLRIIRDAGFKAVEIYGVPPHFDCFDDSHVREIAQCISDTGMRVSALHAPYVESSDHKGLIKKLSLSFGNPAKRQKTIEKTLQAINAASTLGTDIVVVHFGLFGDHPTGSTISNLVSSITSINEKIVGSGVQVAFENIATPISESGYMNYLLGELDLKSMGICLDIAHANINEDPASAIMRCRGRLIHTHISDNRGVEDDHKLPFQGNIRWEEIMQAFEETAYGGCMSFEIRVEEDKAKTLAELWKIYEKLISMTGVTENNDK